MTNFIPIFPLNVVLYPGEMLNLHIFEPRYKELVKECFGNSKPFGIPAVINGHVAEFGTLVLITGDCQRNMITGRWILSPEEQSFSASWRS